MLRHPAIWKRCFRNAAKEKELTQDREFKAVGTKGELRRRMCDLKFSIAWRNRVFQKSHMSLVIAYSGNEGSGG